MVRHIKGPSHYQPHLKIRAFSSSGAAEFFDYSNIQNSICVRCLLGDCYRSYQLFEILNDKVGFVWFCIICVVLYHYI